MPSGITESDGMAYVGRRPWHGLGTSVEGIAMTAEEAIFGANLGWSVKPLKIFIDEFDIQSYREIPKRKAITRLDTGQIFALLSDRYTPIQNFEAFSFFDAIVGAGDAIYHTAGSLFGGRKVWILAKLHGEFTLDSGEKLESFILLDNSHDGTSSLRMRLTTVRVVCSNTLSLASASSVGFKTRHTSGIMTRIGQARDLLGLNKVHMERLMEQCNKLATQKFNEQDMQRLTYKLLHLNPDKALSDQHPNRARAGDTMINLFSSGQGNNGETRWDAYNAVTEFTDYFQGEKGGVPSLDHDTSDPIIIHKRMDASWFPKGDNIRDKAYRILTMPKMEMESALTFS
jgi:phage/plasmid-like protein (TIGR03299 family)